MALGMHEFFPNGHRNAFDFRECLRYSCGDLEGTQAFQGAWRRPSTPYLLSHRECRLKVLLVIGRIQCVVVKCFWEEGVHQGAEGHPVTPTGGEVLEV